MTYDEFKEYLRDFLWKSTDASLLTALDNLIKLATTELDRALTINRREVAATLTKVPDGTNYIDLPSDFKQMISFSGPTGIYSTATEATVEHAIRTSCTSNRVFCLVADKILVPTTFAVGTPSVDFSIVYRTRLPDYKVAGVSWVADDYLDLYTYAVLKHTAPWLREDERSSMWEKFYNTALHSVLEENLWNKEYGGSPLYQNPVAAAFGS